MLVTHTLPQLKQSLSQGQMDIAFGMPLKKEVKRQFKPFNQAFTKHPLAKLITFFSKAPVYEEKIGEMTDTLPFPALYGMIDDEGFAISTLLLNHILQEALSVTDLELNAHHFSEFELAIITKALKDKCGKLELSTEVSLLEPLLTSDAVKSTLFYANRSHITLTLFQKAEKPAERVNVILASKSIHIEKLESLRVGDFLLFENINPKEVRLEGENLPFSLIQQGSQFLIKSKEI